MPSYDFRCPVCDFGVNDVHMRMSEYKRPECVCGAEMQPHITQPPMVHWKDYDFKNGGYQPVSVAGAEPITSRTQEREFMKRNDLIHYNEAFEGRPPSKAEQMQHHNEVVKPTIDKVSDLDNVVADIV